jgi:hypothetical protein
VRAQVERYLKDKDRPAWVRALEAWVMLDTTGLTYQPPSKGLSLNWHVGWKHVPTNQETEVRSQLLFLLATALGKYQGGIITQEDMEKLVPAITITFDGGSTQTAVAWSFYPTWDLRCGNCGCAWTVEWRPYLVPTTLPVTKVTTTTRPSNDAFPGLYLARDDELVDDYPKDALECYQRGRSAYLRRDYSNAGAYLAHAVKLNDQDARFWYFKGLAELARYDEKHAKISVLRGKSLEARSMPAQEKVQLSLKGVPEEAREFLTSVTPLQRVGVPVASTR